MNGAEGDKDQGNHCCCKEIELTMIKQMKKFALIHTSMPGIYLQSFESARIEFLRIEQSKKPAISTSEREVHTQVIELSTLINRELTRATFSKCTVEQIAKALSRGSFVNNRRKTLLNIKAFTYVLSQEEPGKFLNNGVGKGSTKVCMINVLLAT